jgi:hypothetical protein
VTAQIVLAALSLFGAGAATGIVGVVTVAIRREENNNHTLTCGATDHVTQAGRWLNGLYVRTPRPAAAPDLETPLV